MSRTKRRPPTRPQFISEPMRQALASTPMVMNREQSLQFTVMLAANLANLLNSRDQLPWISASIDKRTDGFSLHVEVLPEIHRTDTDATC